MRRVIEGVGLWGLLWLAFSLTAAEPSTSVKELPDGRVQIGLVTLDPKTKALTFPAAVNMTTGLVEYAVVTAGGKVHESVFKTEVAPLHIQTAILLLGVKLQTNSDSAVFFDSKREIPGVKVKIEVAIPAIGKPAVPIDRFLRNAQEKNPAQQNHVPYWIYNGSRFSDGVFLAQRDGSIVSLIADPAALINNPRKDRENDELWTVNTPQVPPIDTAVEVRISLSDAGVVPKKEQ